MTTEDRTTTETLTTAVLMGDEVKKLFASSIAQFIAGGVVGLVVWYTAVEVKFAHAESRIENNERRVTDVRVDIDRRLTRLEAKIDALLVRGGDDAR